MSVLRERLIHRARSHRVGSHVVLLDPGYPGYFGGRFPVDRWLKIALRLELAGTGDEMAGKLALLVVLEGAIWALVEGGRTFQSATNSMFSFHVEEDVMWTTHLVDKECSVNCGCR